MHSMTRARGSLSAGVTLASVAAATTLLAMYAWRGFS